jgi:short-subunit dehydrogenase
MSDLFRGTTALVTGASRGIGARFAEALARRGANLVLVARTAADLEQVAARARAHGGKVDVHPADLGQPDTAAALIGTLEARGVVVDHLVNNAGIGPHGGFARTPSEQHLQTIDLNVRAVTELASRLLPGMVARRRGGILNVASTAAFQGLAWLPVYSGTKAYVVTWSEGVWASLRGSGVRCTCLCPGPVDTPFFDRNGHTARPPRFLMQSSEAVVAAGLRAYERDRCLVMSSWLFGLAAWSVRLAPRSVVARAGAFYTAQH